MNYETVPRDLNRGEHVVAAFLNVEKAFDNVWHNGLRFKIFQLDLPTKMTRGLSDFHGWPTHTSQCKQFLIQPNQPQGRGTTGFCPESITFLIYVNDLPTPHHKQNSLSKFADDTAQWSFSLNIHIAAKLLQQDLLKLAMWCAKWRIKLNPVQNQGDYILQVHTRQKNRTQPKTIWRDTKNLFSSEISRHYFRLPTQLQKAP